MSNIQRFENLKQVVALVQPQFDDLAKIHNAVNYKREASFALQILAENDYLAGVAMTNQDSLKRAIINVAAIGLTLNPIHKLAYLLPRKQKVCLDISYLGYIQLAIEVGAIKWAHSEVVYEKDIFRLRGLGVEPLHEFDPFGERGKIKGCYVVVKTHGGDYLTTRMTIDEIYSIRNRSESWIAGKNSPWKSDENEMIKKTVVRRAYKSWPKTDTRSSRFEQAIDVTNEADPIDFNLLASSAPQAESFDKFVEIREALVKLERTEEQYIAHLTKANRRDIKKLDDLTDIEIDQSKIILTQWLNAKALKEAGELKEADKKQSAKNELDQRLGLENENA